VDDDDGDDDDDENNECADYNDDSKVVNCIFKKHHVIDYLYISKS
jgi:hypothetical protein